MGRHAEFRRSGDYRLARLAAKHGPETTLREVLSKFSYDCLWREEGRWRPKGAHPCGATYQTSNSPSPRSSPGLVKLRVIKGSKSG